MSEPTGSGQALFAIRGLSKAYGATQALRDVDFEVKRGEIHAVLGGNGSGKSTMIKILAGVEKADRGRLETGRGSRDLRFMSPSTAREVGLHFVHQERSVFPELSVAENLSIGRGFETALGSRIEWRRTRSRAASVLRRFQIEAHPDQLLADLGPARQAMVAIARILQDQADGSEDVLILDEPTASLPSPEVELLLDALRRYADSGQSIVFVTHRLEEVFAVADRATLLRDGTVVSTIVPSALSHAGLVELMLGRTVKQVERLRGAVVGEELLRVRGLTSGPITGIDFSLYEGEVVGLAGLLGSGRSTLLKALFGAAPSEAGEVRLAGESLEASTPRQAMAAGLAYIPEDRPEDGAFADLTVRENLSIAVVPEYWDRGLVRLRRERRDAASLMRSFLIRAGSAEAPLESLSGGNQQKVVLARWLRRRPRVLLLDEPTQGVDVGARAEIYELVHTAVSEGAAALLVSSDFEELAHLSDRVLVLRRGELHTELSGDGLDPDAIGSAANAEAAVR